MNAKKQKIAFFDINGTLTRPQDGREFPRDAEDAERIEGMKELVQELDRGGFTIVGISNQGGIQMKHRTKESVVGEMKLTLQLFPELAFILFCPDYEGVECYMVSRSHADKINHECEQPFRKPYAGMVEAALKILQAELDYEESFFMGDRTDDWGCAQAAKLNFKPTESYIARYGQPAEIVGGSGSVIV